MLKTSNSHLSKMIKKLAVSIITPYAKIFLQQPMSKGIDNLDDKHASAQMPKEIGFEGINELSHD